MASRAGATLGGAATGAAVGSALGPIGTGVGAVAGGIIGYLGSGDSGVSTSGGDASSGPRSNFTFGNTGALSGAANYYAAGYDQRAANYDQRAAGYDAQGGVYRSNELDAQTQAANALGYGYGAQKRNAMQAQADPKDLAAQYSALGGLSRNADVLQGMGTAPQGPSYAEAQLRQGQDAANNQSLAMARSGRSLGSGASAMTQAQANNEQANQVTNQQADVARIQEQQQYNQYQLGALGAAQQGYGAAGGQANAINASNTGLQVQNSQLQQSQQQTNNQTSQVYGGIASGLNQAAQGQGQLAQGQGQLAQGQGQLSLGEQQLGFNTRATQLSAGEQYQNSINGNSIAQQGLNNQQTGMYLGAATSAAGAYAASDRDAKKNIKPADGEVPAEKHWYDPLFSYKALGGALGIGQQAPATDPALVRDQNNPSQTVSPYQSISDASHSARSPYVTITPTPADAPYPGDVNPYMASDVHSKTAIHALTAQNQALAEQVRALSSSTAPTNSITAYPAPPAAPSMPMLNQAAADQDLGSKIVYPQDAAPPSPDMLNQAASDQYAASDVHSKREIESLRAQVAALSGADTQAGSFARPAIQQPDTAALDAAYRREGSEPAVDLRPAQAYSYEYKDPERHGQGRFYGPMAQDLEKTAPGASVVKQASDGTKVVDTSRLSLVNTGAISEQQRKMQELQAQVDALSGGRSVYPVPRQPNTIDLDRGMRLGGTY